MFRLMMLLRPALMAAVLVVAHDTGALDRFGQWALTSATEQHGAACCQTALPAGAPGSELVTHVREIHALARWASSFGGLELPPS